MANLVSTSLRDWCTQILVRASFGASFSYTSVFRNTQIGESRFIFAVSLAQKMYAIERGAGARMTWNHYRFALEIIIQGSL